MKLVPMTLDGEHVLLRLLALLRSEWTEIKAGLVSKLERRSGNVLSFR